MDKLNDFDFIIDNVILKNGITDEDEVAKPFIDTFTTKEQRIRDKYITELLETYVDGYKYKVKSNKWYRRAIVAICLAVVVFISVAFFKVLWAASEWNISVNGTIQLISVLVMFLSLIIGILKIITKYIFPEKEEEYITRIVEIIQTNDLENKKENIKNKG